MGMSLAELMRFEPRQPEHSVIAPLSTTKDVMKKLLTRVALCVGLVAGASSSQAALVHWTLDGVRFNDGSTASGSFDFNADTSTFTNVLITTTAASITYVTTDLATTFFGLDASGINLIDDYLPAGDNTGHAILNLDFLSPLTNAGGIVGLVTGFPSFEGNCGIADCSSGGISREALGDGRVIGAAVVPAPAGLGLVGLGLVGLGLTRRPRR